MLRFIGRWLSDSLRFGLGLLLALSALQIPAVTNAYTAALLQIAEDARRDIGQREAVARQYYHWPELTAGPQLIEALRPVEPANAEALATSTAREQALRQTYDTLAAADPLLRPMAAVWNLLADDRGDKRAILRTALATHAPNIVLSLASALYGLAGLMLGLLLAQVVLAVLHGFGRRKPRGVTVVAERRAPTLRA